MTTTGTLCAVFLEFALGTQSRASGLAKFGRGRKVLFVVALKVVT